MEPVATAEGGLRRCQMVDGDLFLVLNNSLNAIEDGRVPLASFCEQHAVDAKAINRLEVIFEELVSNTIRHGFTPLSGQSVRVWARKRPNLVELIFEDDGAPFDPLAAPEPTPFDSLETAKIGGLGIPLVVRLSAAVRYERPAPAERPDQDGFAPNNRMTVTVWAAT